MTYYEDLIHDLKEKNKENNVKKLKKVQFIFKK